MTAGSKLAAAVAAIVVPGGLAVAIVVAVGGDAETRAGYDMTTGADARRCYAAWNAAADDELPYKRAAGNQTTRTRVVATVGFSENRPDLCQVVVAQPDLAGGVAYVFRERPLSREPFAFLPGSRVDELPESARVYNARVMRDGSIGPAPG